VGLFPQVAIEYWLSLRYSPNSAWLATAAPQLMEEIQGEMDKVGFGLGVSL
jgi:hypothetical protein